MANEKARSFFHSSIEVSILRSLISRRRIRSRPPTSYRAAGRLPWERGGRGGEVDKPGGLPVGRGVIVILK